MRLGACSSHLSAGEGLSASEHVTASILPDCCEQLVCVLHNPSCSRAAPTAALAPRWSRSLSREVLSFASALCAWSRQLGVGTDLRDSLECQLCSELLCCSVLCSLSKGEVCVGAVFVLAVLPSPWAGTSATMPCYSSLGTRGCSCLVHKELRLSAVLCAASV